MTLIITVEARNHLVVTADGRSKGTVENNTLQKIFTHKNRSFAIAHHGQNLIENRKVEDIANDFLINNAKVIGKSSIQHIAWLFVDNYGQIIKKTLAGIKGNKGCGFIFLGFGIATKDPKIYEVFWATGHVNTIAPKKHNNLVLSGDAKKYIDIYLEDSTEKEFRRKQILKGKIEAAKVYSDKLYKLAEDAQARANEDIFGGHKHQVVIRKDSCEWLIPPYHHN